ncbi:MAG: ABC transporter ATP-binding protein [Sedimentisphaerales bacterium]|nr:ABC transporter ATP-binding protein [Sedimentisphaerales bacterium]
MMQNNKYAIETFSLTKIFSDLWGRAKVTAVNNLNLQVRYNEVFGLLGPNGSGKTTTIKLLLGLLHPTKGKTLVLGGDATTTKISSRIGFLPEESYLYKYLTAREILDFYASLFSLPARVRKSRIEALLDMVGLRAAANRQVGTFSKGMARRIGLAQALINDPDLLILDEPTTGLDPIGTRQIKDLIAELAKRGKTVLLCSHLLADVEDVCDRISILYGGSIQAEGKVKDLLQQTYKTQIISDSLNPSTIESIKGLIIAEKKDFEITSPMEKLESFFIRTVAKAQTKAATTSGAVSTTQIGEFLTAKDKEKGILDKLVTAETQKEPKSEPVQTQKPAEVHIEQRPDTELIRKLTGQEDGPKPVEQKEQIASETEEEEKIREDLLKELTDSQTDNADKQADENKGRAGNA